MYLKYSNVAPGKRRPRMPCTSSCKRGRNDFVDRAVVAEMNDFAAAGLKDGGA